MIQSRLKKISKVDYLLNSLLDSGLYFVNKEHLNFFIGKYISFNRVNVKNKVYSYVIENKEDFLNFIKVKYG